ncbi:hypothetical protein GCM10017667_44160 [Streptomyces filamentosus]|uniref:Uncharacterized protein n=1 Tax=Streptomyces filamentosus TaxID=67294 RepID=A0A919EPU1_STRFL|nr:hypothetical protein GCM10017667_44160 [Streptomyces filamentosus]
MPPVLPVDAGSVVQAVITLPARTAAATARRALWAMSGFLSGRASDGRGPEEGAPRKSCRAEVVEP